VVYRLDHRLQDACSITNYRSLVSRPGVVDVRHLAADAVAVAAILQLTAAVQGDGRQVGVSGLVQETSTEVPGVRVTHGLGHTDQGGGARGELVAQRSRVARPGVDVQRVVDRAGEGATPRRAEPTGLARLSSVASSLRLEALS